MLRKFKFIPFLIIFLFSGTLFAQKKGIEKVTVKVLSFNILHGKTTNGSFDLDIIANVIKKADADFVSLQEVDFKTNRAKKYDLPTELGYRTKKESIFGRDSAL